MNTYEPATPRTALGALALTLTIITFGLFVAGPVALAANGGYGESCGTAGPMVATGIAVDSVRMLPAVEVVASRRVQG